MVYIIIKFYIVLILSTSSLQGYSLHRAFLFAKELGFSGLDISLSYENYDFWDLKYIRGMSKDFGLPIVSITAPSRGLDIEMVDKISDLASGLGCQLVVFTPPHFSDKNTDWYYNYLPKLNERVEYSVAIQNVESKFLFFVIPERKNASLEEIKKITGNTVLDLSNIDSSSMDIIKAEAFLGGSIRSIFLNDRTASKSGLLPGKAGNNLSHLPIESLFMKLKKSGYSGFITIKVDPLELGVGDEEIVIGNLESIQKYYKKHFTDYE